MTALNIYHIIGIAFTLMLISGVGIYSGRRVKNPQDFSGGGGRTGPVIIAGTIMGTLVGGASTVGTAQLAFSYGFSAWWFTLGAGIGCLILALFFVNPLRAAGRPTLIGMIADRFGQRAGVLSSILSCLGIIINIVAQLLAAAALITAVFPIGTIPCAMIAAALMACYVIFGGVWGTGLVGVVKLVLLYVAVIAGGATALYLSGGLGALYGSLDHGTYFNLFARGIGKDSGAGLSLILGILSTQTYAQACLSGRSDTAARKGSLISLFMIPPIGIGGIIIGMYMKLNFPDIAAKEALPIFMLSHMPPLLGGIIMATLLVAVVGTGAGLALGIGTIISTDIISRFTRILDRPGTNLFVNRLLIVLILAVGVCFTGGGMGDIILNFSFMSMGLRAAVVFVPLCAALFWKGEISSGFINAAIIAGPVSVLIGKFFIKGMDPLFTGMAISLVIVSAGAALGRKHRGTKISDR